MPSSSQFEVSLKNEILDSDEYKNEKRKSSFLAAYFIHRYHIRLDSSVAFTFQDAFRKKIDSIIKNNKPLNELYHGAPISEVTINEFNTHCLGHLCEYIRKTFNESHFDEKVLYADESNYFMSQYQKKLSSKKSLNEMAPKERSNYLETLRDELVKSQNYIYESGNFSFPETEPQDENDDSWRISDLKETGYRMMIEAVYNYLFDSFNWDLLHHDMINKSFIEGQYNEDISIDSIAALIRLSDYTYYTGFPRKDISIISQNIEENEES